MKPSWTGVPRALTSSTTRCVSAMVSAIGFSLQTALPARAAISIRLARALVGVTITTAPTAGGGGAPSPRGPPGPLGPGHGPATLGGGEIGIGDHHHARVGDAGQRADVVQAHAARTEDGHADVVPVLHPESAHRVPLV